MNRRRIETLGWICCCSPYTVEDKPDFELNKDGVPSFVIDARNLYDDLLKRMAEAEISWEELERFSTGYDRLIIKHEMDFEDVFRACGRDTTPKSLKEAVNNAEFDTALNELIKNTNVHNEQGIYSMDNLYISVYQLAYLLNMAIDCEYKGNIADRDIALSQALSIDMRESNADRQSRNSSGPNWHTQPLIEMCKDVRQEMPYGTADEIFNAMPDAQPVAPITKIKIGIDDNLYIEAAKSPCSDVPLKRGSFRDFLGDHDDEIGRKKLRPSRTDTREAGKAMDRFLNPNKSG